MGQRYDGSDEDVVKDLLVISLYFIALKAQGIVYEKGDHKSELGNVVKN